MTLPRSFLTEGFLPAETVRKTRHLLIGTDGPTDTGKTEFALSAPGPGVVICLDRNIDPVLDNLNPPATRQPDFAFKIIKVPLATTSKQDLYMEYWRDFRDTFYKALKNPDCRTVVLDGDSDSWELQRLAEFGKLTQIPSIMYTGVNAARRAFIARAHDSGKIVIATHKIKKQYRTKYDADGKAVLNDSGKEIREWDGTTYDRQGFEDQDYLWHVQLRHVYRPARINPLTRKDVPQQWGVVITKCKVNMTLVGTELWGDSCNFQSLVELLYPNVSLSEWGFK